jgi:protein gp37
VAENSAIEWCDHTFNPWEGCQKVGPGCDHCYAETRNARFGGGAAPNWGPGAPRRRTSPSNWAKPLRWQREAAAFMAAHGRRQRVFCSSLADVFDNAVDPQWRDDLWRLILNTPDLDWLLLTKRIGNVANMLPVPFDFERMYPNVWLGATIINQAEADRDIPKLLATSARVRFLSMEPLLGPVDLRRVVLKHTQDRNPGAPATVSINALFGWMGGANVDGRTRIDWVIAGGESGPGARPSHLNWYRELRDQCVAAGVPFLFKQWGEHAPYRGEGGTDGFWLDPDGHVYGGPTNWPPLPDERRVYTTRYGKKAAGRLLDGVTHDGFPA